MLHSIYSRLALLLMVLALAAGLAFTTLRPVDAATPTRAAVPGQIVQGYADGPGQIANTMTKVRTMKLPAGTWAVSAKLMVEGGTYADCQLSAPGATNDVAKAGLYGTTGATVTETLSMHTSFTQATAGKVTVSCTDQGSTMNWWYLRITAISGGPLTVKAL